MRLLMLHNDDCSERCIYNEFFFKWIWDEFAMGLPRWILCKNYEEEEEMCVTDLNRNGIVSGSLEFYICVLERVKCLRKK